jgi:hypothetical protein
MSALRQERSFAAYRLSLKDGHRFKVVIGKVPAQVKAARALSRATLCARFSPRTQREFHMRLPILDPKDLSNEQKPLYEDMRAGIESHFKGFVNMRPDGALLGPWNPWLREPQFGKPVWELVKAMVSNPSLPAAVREVAILVTGSHFRSGYELYAHVLVAEQRGLSDEKLATIVAGQSGPISEVGRRQSVVVLLSSLRQ